MQDEIEEMKRKFKIMNHQVEQLKEEIGAKDLALVKEHFDHMKVRLTVRFLCSIFYILWRQAWCQGW